MLDLKIIHKICFYTIVVLSCSLAACSSVWHHEFYHPILGAWENERGIIIEIRTASGKAEALTIHATGYDAESVQAKQLLISEIIPMQAGTYKGTFLMPGNQKPLTVRLGLISNDILLITSWDKRANKRMMKWQRVDK